MADKGDVPLLGPALAAPGSHGTVGESLGRVRFRATFAADIAGALTVMQCSSMRLTLHPCYAYAYKLCEASRGGARPLAAAVQGSTIAPDVIAAPSS